MASCSLLPTRRLSSPALSWSSTAAISPSRRSLMPCIDTGRVSLFFEDAGSGHSSGAAVARTRGVQRKLARGHRASGAGPPGDCGRHALRRAIRKTARAVHDGRRYGRSRRFAAVVEPCNPRGRDRRCAGVARRSALLALRHPARVRRPAPGSRPNRRLSFPAAREGQRQSWHGPPGRCPGKSRDRPLAPRDGMSEKSWRGLPLRPRACRPL